MRTAGLVLVPAAAVVAARRGRLRVPVAVRLARSGFVFGGHRGCRRGHLRLDAQALGFLFFLALAFGGFLDATLVLFGQALLLGQVAQPRFLELAQRSEEPTSELQSLMRISYAVFCLKKKNENQ